MELRAWGRLLRVSLAPTAAADVGAGLLLGHGGALPGWRATLLLVGASLCVLHGNLALNDWRDRAADRAARRARPLAAGAIPAGAALAAAALLCAAGVALASAVRPAAGVWISGVALAAALYNLGARGPLAGPALLGLCRGGNLALGLVAAAAFALPAAAWSAPLLYGLYVALVARLSRLEDGQDAGLAGGRPRRLLFAAAAVLLAAGGLPVGAAGPGARAAALLLAGAGAWGLTARALSPAPWTPAAVGAAMGLALRRLLVFTAACALLAGTPAGWIAAGAILLGYPLSWSLREAFPPS